MRLYFKNRRSPKPYKVVITSLENSRIGFIGEITNPTMKIGNGVVQFYLAPIATEGTWTVDNNYHYKDGKLTVMSYKNLNYTNYNSHATYSNFITNIQTALEYIEFHQYKTVTDAVKAITELEGVEWTYDQENKRVIYYTDNKSGNLSLKDIATQINSFLISEDSVLKSNSELLVKEVVDDYFKPSPKGLIPANAFNTQFVNNAVIIKLGDKEYQDTYLNSKTTSSLNFHQDLTDRIPGTAWYTESEGQVVVGGEAFSNKAYYSNGVIGNSLQTPSKLLTGGSTPFTISFDVLIKEDQVKASRWPHLALFSKTTNTAYGDQFLYIQPEANYRLAFRRSPGVGGNVINEVVGNRRIEFNTKYTIKIVYDSNMFKVFVNNELDFQFGTSIGWYVDSNQPYRFLDDFVPAYPLEGNRGFTKGFVDNIQVQDGVALDPTKTVNAYSDSLISKLTFQGQTGKANFVDEADSLINWTGYGDAKLVQTNELGLYSYLSLNGMGSYIRTTDSDIFKFNNKFTIHMKFKTATKSKRQVLLDRYSGSAGSYQVSINTDGKLYFTVVQSGGWKFLESNISNLNDGNTNTIDIVKDGSSLSFYINGLLDTMHDVSGEVFNGSVVNTTIGAQINNRNEEYDFNGNIYEFEVYKGVAVYPNIIAKELNKIELNFDTGTPIDAYDNSIWSNSGVTFNTSDSIFGNSAYFGNSSQKLYTSSNSLFNFETNNFKITMDIKATEDRVYSTILNSTTTDGTQNGAWIGRTHLGNNKYHLGFGLNGGYESYSSQPLNINTHYNISLIKTNNVVFGYINNVVVSCLPKDSSVNFSHGGGTQIGHGWANNYSTNKFVGYIDRFNVEKGYSTESVIDTPAIHLPLKSDVSNLGFANLTINSVGNPTYTTVEGRKCIKFEQGKYLTINSNNIFNLGTSSDFYIEMDVYLISLSTFNSLLRNIGSWDTTSSSIQILSNGVVNLYAMDDKIGSSSNTINISEFNNLRVYRKGNVTSINLNGIVTTFNDLAFDFSKGGSQIGSIDVSPGSYINGYMSNFKMFIGTSEIPKSYNDKQILDLDFKPTYNSYLFKDNFNKCVIHPVNISYRNYEDGQYCLKFKNNIEHLLLGKNSLLNFGTDDFIINFKFRNVEDGNWNILLASNISGENDFNYRYISIGSKSRAVPSRVHIHIGTEHLISDNEVSYDEINNLTIVRENTTLKIILNDVETVFENRSDVFNFNNANDTKIGSSFASNSSSHGFKGTLYSIKMFRGTSDLSLLDETALEPESPADVILDGIPPLEPGVLQFWQPRQEVDPHNVVLEFKQLRLN